MLSIKSRVKITIKATQQVTGNCKSKWLVNNEVNNWFWIDIKWSLFFISYLPEQFIINSKEQSVLFVEQLDLNY